MSDKKYEVIKSIADAYIDVTNINCGLITTHRYPAKLTLLINALKRLKQKKRLMKEGMLISIEELQSVYFCALDVLKKICSFDPAYYSAGKLAEMLLMLEMKGKSWLSHD